MSREGVILQVVRGERPLAALSEAGLIVKSSYDRGGRRLVYDITNTRNTVAVAKAVDLAMGLLSYLDRPRELRRWAGLIQAGVNFLDIDVEDDPFGEILLDAVWSASFGELVSPEAVAAARVLVERRRTGR
jgi:hypothetical protein